MRRAAVVLGLVVLAAMAVFVTWASWRHGQRATAPTPGAAAAVAGTAESSAAVGESAAPTPERAPAGVATASIVGTARWRSGEPLVNWPVTLRRPTAEDEAPRMPAIPIVRDLRRDTAPMPSLTMTPASPLQTARTDANGAFAFAEVPPGAWRLGLDGAEGGTDVTVAAGERCTVELEVPGVMVHGSLHRGGVPWPATRVDVHSGGYRIRQPSCDGASFRCLLQPGIYEFHLLNPNWPVAPTNVHSIVVPADTPIVARQFEVGGTDLVVDVRLGAGGSCRAFTVRLDGTLVDGARAVREFAGIGGRAAFDQVPAGTWQVSVKSPEIRSAPERQWQSTNAIPRDRLEFVVEPAGIVRLALRQAGGRLVRVAADVLPSLVVGDTAVPCVALEHRDGTKWPTRVGWQNVPAGPVRVRLEDVRRAGEIEFLPFDEVPVVDVDVVPGADNEVVIDVTPRAFVDVRACDSAGREDPKARVEVFDGAIAVVRRAVEPQRWSGWLPPGDYRLLVTRGGDTREQSLRVGRADVALRCRP
jgi:hypothetical protein